MAKSEVIFYSSSLFFFGIVFASFSVPLLWIFVSCAFIFGGFWYRNFFMEKRVVVLFFISILLGTLYYHGFATIKERGEALPTSEFSGLVSAEPKIFEKTQVVSLKLLPPHQGNVHIFTTPLADFAYGEKLIIKGSVKNGSWPEENTAFYPEIQKSRDELQRSLRQILIENKMWWIDNFKKLFSSEEAALIGGLTFGVRGDFSENFKEAMAKSGTTHLVALSGYNIAILIWALERILRSRLSRKILFFATLGIIGTFVLTVGAEASVTRAAIMGGLILFASQSGRLYSFRHAVLYAALLMTLWNPSMPRYDLGFQLSFFSLLGIAFLEPALSKSFWGDKKKNSFLNWKENAAVTIAAQAAVLPILISNFGTFSVTSILANVLILWVVPFTMALGFLTILLSSFHISLAFIIQPILDISLSYIIMIVNLTALIPPVSFPWGVWLTVIYYGLLILFIHHRNHEAFSA